LKGLPVNNNVLGTKSNLPETTPASETPADVSEGNKGVKLLRGFASIVKTRGKGLLQNVQNILPGSEKASNYCYYQ
jgi:hypothetical protein